MAYSRFNQSQFNDAYECFSCKNYSKDKICLLTNEKEHPATFCTEWEEFNPNRKETTHE